MRYTATFTGRTAGAIGIFHRITTEVSGATPEAARLALYDRYEHIHQLALTPATRQDYCVTYEDGNSTVTGFNGTLEDAERYYIGQLFQFGDTEECPRDKMVKAAKVEQL